MPLSRKRPFSKTSRRTKYVRRVRPALASRYRRARRGMMSRQNHAYRRYGVPSTVTMTGTVGVVNESDNSDVFTLSSVTNYSELTTLYDQYHINAVTMKFHLVSNPDRLTTPGTDPAANYLTPPNYPKLWYYRDYDDSAPLTLTQMREVGKAKFKIMRPNSVISIRVRPAVLTQLYRTAVTTGYTPSWPKRLDCTQADIPHYGLKWILETDGVSLFNTSQYIVRIEYVYDLTFFNSR